MSQKYPPVPWNKDWAQAAGLFAEHPFGPYTRDELRWLIFQGHHERITPGNCCAFTI